MTAPTPGNADIVWHHTTAAGLIGMATQHALWASSVSFMNDTEESGFARTAIDRAFKALIDEDSRYRGVQDQYFDWLRGGGELSNGFSVRFVACATRLRDDLGLWRAYGPADVAGTFAVGLDRSSPLGVVADSGLGLSHPGGWLDVEYQSPDATAVRAVEALKDAISIENLPDGDVLRQRVLEALRKIETRLKHVAFVGEQEVRLTAVGGPYRLRPGRFGPVPYVELASVGNWGDVAPTKVEEREPLPIVEVIAWPGAPQQALEGAAAALTKAGHSHTLARWGASVVRISESNVPFV